ncbi:hypothetical protein [Sphingomonas sp.]|uniref:DUF6975 family protein n=1 Tax=Sphingomonas sp. TaxID=28214 RepID=UPI001D208005|nr:hypothetical protein [Sphingomonas sp.]MBX9796120.1 hypothetical protein [Sphingomonas sp.]
MALDPSINGQFDGSWGMVRGLMSADGSGQHRFVGTLARSNALARDVADAVHALCMLHGRQPGLLDHALACNAQPAWAPWLEAAVEAFAAERALLARLTAAAGPLPSTPGQAESDSTIMSQRHALDTLARSDRRGCAVGAAVALVADWRAVRAVLDRAADRFGVPPVTCQLPDDADTAMLVATLAASPAAERAMAFGAQQLLAQHNGLWSLMEARASARNNA